MREDRQEEECRELRKLIKHMSERQGKLLAMMERKNSSETDTIPAKMITVTNINLIPKP